MTKKIFKAIFSVALVMLAASLALFAGVLYDHFTQNQAEDLRLQNALIAHGIENEGAAYLTGLSAGACRVTWVAKDGSVLYDSEADASAMGSHLDRPEIAAALETGEGESARFSDTMMEKTFYFARRLADGTVLRTSGSRYTVLTLISDSLPLLIFVLMVTVVLTFLLASRLSKRLVEPINSLDLDDPLSNDTYEELSPLLTRIERQHRQIALQMDELRQKQDEFNAITGDMSEGLILLDEHDRILSINRSAARLFGAEGDPVGRDMLTLDRSLTLQKLLSGADDGSMSEATEELDSGVYRLTASPVLSGEKRSGTVLLAVDMTDKAEAEKMRREFTANVSHELKTPLQSIMGSAELLKDGMVAEGDRQGFYERIHAESGRLVTLVNDIIRLSRLDEQEGMLPTEEIELLEIAGEAATALAQPAKLAGVTVSVTGAPAYITGVRQLVCTIVYNLLDNAIKYGRPGGHADIDVTPLQSGAELTVTDDGIGISPEHQARVFERFYRVDKSRSKATGGTGLGLSIVKHSAQYMGAAVSLESGDGKTVFTVSFK